MSKLEELIKQYCPDGVEYKKICDIGVFLKGMTGVSKKWEETGNCRFIDYKNVYNNLKIDVSSIPYATVKNCNNQTIIKTGDVLFTSASETPDECAISSVIESELPDNIFLDDHLFGVRFDKNIINATYINYYCRSADFRKKVNKTVRGVTRYYISMSDFAEIVVPVPPLEVQREIVRVLDSFTFLSAELSAELQARKKQYNFYRDKLLEFSKDTQLLPLGEVCELQAGKAIRADLISNMQTDILNIPCYGANGIRGYIDIYNQEGNKTIIGRQGALCGNVCYATGQYYATEHAITVTDKGFFNSRYLFHALKHANLNQYKTAGAQPGLSVSRLNNVEIAVPSLNVQNKIAQILDNFESICNDLNIGLPAEIEARQKQYEYYRDMLLTFAETGDIMPQTDRQTDRQTDKQ